MVPHDKDKDNPSELIRGKDVAAFGLWSLPSFDEPRDEPAVAAPQVPAVAEPAPAPPAVEEVELETVKPPTLEEIEAIRQDAYNEGFATGERDGFHAGQLKARQEAEEALKERLQSLERLMTQLLEPIAEQDALIEQGMVNLVNHVARQVIQRELHMDSSHVRQVLREALKLLPMGAANIRIHVTTRRTSSGSRRCASATKRAGGFSRTIRCCPAAAASRPSTVASTRPSRRAWRRQ